MAIEDDNDSKLDFGAGKMSPLPSRCLRTAKIPTDCDICVEVCPFDAIFPHPLEGDPEAENFYEEYPSEEFGQKPTMSKLALSKFGISFSVHCINCGICATSCPVDAISSTKQYPRDFEQRLKKTSDDFEGIVIGCARSLFGISKKISEKAITIPCLGAVAPEGWFLAAAIARDAVYDPITGAESEVAGDLKVYLPPMICENCPANLLGDAETLYTDAITVAEEWGAFNIELVDNEDDLAFYQSGNLVSTLGEVSSEGKRELVEQLAAGFGKSWQSAGTDLSRQKVIAELRAKKRAKARKPVLAKKGSVIHPFGRKSQRRQMLRSALLIEPGLEDEVNLLCTTTIHSLCNGCGDCIKACPIGARKLVSSTSALYYSELPEKERPKGTQGAVTDQLCCLGCSACVLACPTGACQLDTLSGADFYNLRES